MSDNTIGPPLVAVSNKELEDLFVAIEMDKYFQEVLKGRPPSKPKASVQQPYYNWSKNYWKYKPGSLAWNFALKNIEEIVEKGTFCK